MTIAELPNFLQTLTGEYSHDYGTICHAAAIAAQAAVSAIDHSNQGGVTGFQTSAIMFEFIKNLCYSSNKTGLRIVDYDNFLYPQYDYKFKTIRQSTWKAIQQIAINNMVDSVMSYKEYMRKRDQYAIDIKIFIDKYPDYIENPGYYTKTYTYDGTQKKWKTQHEELPEFEFAPVKPYDQRAASKVRAHWDSIIRGEVPFGYIVSND